MEKTININELIELTEKKIIQKKNKTEKQINLIEKKLSYLEIANNIGNIIFQILLVIILALITFGMPIGAVASILFSFNNFKKLDEFVIVTTGVPVPAVLFASTAIWLRYLSETYKKLSDGIYETFEIMFDFEKKIFDLIYDKKSQKLHENSKVLSEQLTEIAWFKENYQYLSRNMIMDKKVSEEELMIVDKMLKKESPINIFFLLCTNNLNKLRNKENLQKEALKNKIKCIAEEVKKETETLQQEINKKIMNGERVKRIERYHVIEQAYDKVEKKIRRLSPKR